MKTKFGLMGIFLVVFLFLWFVPLSFSWAITPKISAGLSHTPILQSDGTLWAWGL